MVTKVTHNCSNSLMHRTTTIKDLYKVNWPSNQQQSDATVQSAVTAVPNQTSRITTIHKLLHPYVPNIMGQKKCSDFETFLSSTQTATAPYHSKLQCQSCGYTRLSALMTKPNNNFPIWVWLLLKAGECATILDSKKSESNQSARLMKPSSMNLN